MKRLGKRVAARLNLRSAFHRALYRAMELEC